jgi:biotin carboxylase
MMDRKATFLLMSSFYKGHILIEECKKLGVHTVFLTVDSLKDKAWPWESIDEKFFMPESFKQPDLTNAVSYLARERDIDSIIPLDDFDVEVAASLREHLRCPGMGDTTARFFRDKLAMRVEARDQGIPVPDFVHVLNHAAIHEFTQRVPAPWVLKPRSQAGAIGIKKLHNTEQLWEQVNKLGDDASNYLIEAYVPGDVFHVDSTVNEKEILFSLPSRYHTPPFDVWNGGGVFMSQTVDPKTQLFKDLQKINQEVISKMRLVRGVVHAEFIQGKDGQLYFLEMAARVGGANLDQLVEAASGINHWREWPRLELAYIQKTKYKSPKPKNKQAGLLICLARQEKPDLSMFNDPEVVWKLQEDYHAGIIVAADSAKRVSELMSKYVKMMQESVLAVAPPTETAVH